MATIPSEIDSALGGKWINDRYHATCPNCGKPAKSGQVHFSIKLLNTYIAWYCWACGVGGGKMDLLEILGMADSAEREYREIYYQPKEKQAKTSYKIFADRYVDEYCSHPLRLEYWQAYKQLSMESIAEYRLGVGVLPNSQCRKSRLIIPVYNERGHCIALHGRSYRKDDTELAKWLTAGGSNKKILFNAHKSMENKTVVIVENMIDAILVGQGRTDLLGLASGGTSWQSSWTQFIIDQQPKNVIIFLDNDLAGQAQGAVYEKLKREWVEEIKKRNLKKMPKLPKPKGPQILAEFLQAQYDRALLYEYPSYAPGKADYSWMLENGKAHAHVS